MVKKADDFIGLANEDLSNDEDSDVESEVAPIGLDEQYLDDGQGLYSDDEEEEEDGDEEDAEANDDEGDDDDDIEDEDDDEDEDEDEEFPSINPAEFDDGDPDDLAQEGEEDEDDEELDDMEPVSKKTKLGSLARKLAVLEEEIADLEKQQIENKHWTLSGEVSAKSRPLNSVLESNIELPFGHMSMKRLDDSRELIIDENDFDEENPDKPRFDIELIIRQRVADKTFDDVVKRNIETVIHTQKPTDANEGLNFEKSQLGLAEVYAQQYEQDIFNQSANTEKQSAEREAAKNTFAKLMHKLDCLTNFNFAPRPPVVRKSADGVKDLPAMKLEEPIPLIISSSIRANTLAR